MQGFTRGRLGFNRGKLGLTREELGFTRGTIRLPPWKDTVSTVLQMNLEHSVDAEYLKN